MLRPLRLAQNQNFQPQHHSQFSTRLSKIGCEKVLGPKRGGPDEIKLRQLPNGDTTGDFIPAESGWSVMVLPGAGAEPAEFGLCRYPCRKPLMLSFPRPNDAEPLVSARVVAC